MDNKQRMAQWPEVKELISEARLADASKTYDRRKSAVELAIYDTLGKIHSICMVSPREHYRVYFDPIDLISKFARLAQYWRELDSQALKEK